MTALFHSSPVPLGSGSVIEPGNWGRIVRTYGPAAPGAGVPTNGMNEIALEFARLAFAPTKPSRLDCVFAVESLETAMTYRNQHHVVGIIYRVEAVDPTLPQHVGDYSIPIAIHESGFVPAALERFRSYWVDEHSASREVLLSSAVRILERLG